MKEDVGDSIEHPNHMFDFANLGDVDETEVGEGLKLVNASFTVGQSVIRFFVKYFLI